MFKTYILYTDSKDRYYVGHTSNIDDRLIRHNQGRSKSTKYGIPWRVLYTKDFETKSEAYTYEMYIKNQKSRIFIERLIKELQK